MRCLFNGDKVDLRDVSELLQKKNNKNNKNSFFVRGVAKVTSYIHNKIHFNVFMLRSTFIFLRLLNALRQITFKILIK